MPVALGARRTDKLERIVQQIEQGGGRALAMATDVTDPTQCKAIVQACAERFGSVYAVYANAGYGEEISMEDMGDQRLRAIFETNFFGTMNLIWPGLEAMRQSPTSSAHRGHVLICSSCLSNFSVPFYGAYSATKAAQAHVGRAMRHELLGEGIQVSTVHPIGTRTELFDKVAERSGPSRVSNHTPSRFMQTADFVAQRTVACLRRPRAEVWTGFAGVMVRTGMAIGAMLPGLSDRAVRLLMKRRIAQHQQPHGQ